MTLGQAPPLGPLADEYESYGPAGGKYRDPGSRADELARAVIGAAIAVHRAIGPAHEERVYERALAVELEHQGIPFRTQMPYELRYRDIVVGQWRLDMLVDEWIIVEIKSVERLSTVHVVQCAGYLRVTELPLALLINFNVGLLREGVRRVVPRVP